MTELLKCTFNGCEATASIKLWCAPGCNKYRCISCVKTLILKHGLEHVNDPDDNLTPILHFCNKKCYRVVMRVINSVDDLYSMEQGWNEWKTIPTTPWPCSSNGSQNMVTMNDFVVQGETAARRRQTYVYLLLI